MFQPQKETDGARPQHDCKMPHDLRPAVLASMLAKFVERWENLLFVYGGNHRLSHKEENRHEGKSVVHGRLVDSNAWCRVMGVNPGAFCVVSRATHVPL